MSGSEEFTPVLLGLGVRNLSMASPRVAAVVERIKTLRIRDCEALVERMLSADGANQAKELLHSAFRPRKL
jgi:phosphotransferase system enzyme I (PtsI)